MADWKGIKGNDFGMPDSLERGERATPEDGQKEIGLIRKLVLNVLNQIDFCQHELTCDACLRL